MYHRQFFQRTSNKGFRRQIIDILSYIMVVFKVTMNLNISIYFHNETLYKIPSFQIFRSFRFTEQKYYRFL